MQNPNGVNGGSDTSKEYDAHVEDAGHFVPGYGKERDHAATDALEADPDDNPRVHQQMDFRLFTALAAMSFLWVGSQIPLYLFGSVLPLIYADVGGYDIYVWAVIGYLIPNAALCPFVGALSDMFGRKIVGGAGQVFLIVGPIVTVTANDMLTVVGGQVISGIGAGLNELIALAGTAELVPVRKRGMYVGLVVFTILPFCPSALWAQLIAKDSSWRYVGILVAVWNFIGLLLLTFGYRDPAKDLVQRSKAEILREIDYVGGILSTAGVLLFMMGMQWGAVQYSWDSVHVLVPFILGIVLIIAFFAWEVKFAPYPMVPKNVFSKAPRTMIGVLLITFFSGANFFVMLLFWPTEVFNVYGYEPIPVGIRTLPIGFGIIGGAAIGLVLISVTKGRTKILMIISTVIMTAGTGTMSLAKTDNLNAVYAIVTIASVGVGLVIIPCSIIAQIVCPVELIGTITAVTLAIRYIGGAVGFTAYFNILEHKYLERVSNQNTSYPIFLSGVSLDPETITTLITLSSEAMYDDLRAFIAESPNVANKTFAYDVVTGVTEEAYALAYRWPYWISIAFGGVCIVCAVFLQDVRKFM